MKKIVFFLLAGALVMTSCNRDESNIFGDTPTARVQNYLDSVSQILLAAPNGWAMYYFPTDDQGGTVMLAKFAADSKVLMADYNREGDHYKYQTDNQGTWKLITDQGPVLSFDTYNAVMHKYADPSISPAGEGMMGDYEFLILSYSHDQILLKGKKRGTYIHMYPMAADQDWPSYYSNVEDMFNTIFLNNDGAKMNFVAGGKSRQMEYSDGAFYEKLGEDEYNIFNFLIDHQGVVFYNNGIEFDSKKAIHFGLNADKSQLVCTDADVDAHFEAAVTAAEFLQNKLENGSRWIIKDTEMGSAAQSIYDDIINTAKGTGASNVSMAIRKSKNAYVMNINYRVGAKSYVGTVNLNMDMMGQNVTISLGDADSDAQVFMRRCAGNSLPAGQMKFKNLFNGTFEVTNAVSPLNSQIIRLVKTDNAEHSFIMNL